MLSEVIARRSYGRIGFFAKDSWTLRRLRLFAGRGLFIAYKRSLSQLALGLMMRGNRLCTHIYIQRCIMLCLGIVLQNLFLSQIAHKYNHLFRIVQLTMPKIIPFGTSKQFQAQEAFYGNLACGDPYAKKRRTDDNDCGGLR